jgi:hypothetical protein
VSKRIVPITIAVSLAFAGSAQAKQYVLKHPKREHCKAHYVRKVEHVKKREHGQLVKVKETVCVYVTPKTSAKAKTPSPATAAPVRAVHLKAHLDPSFTRNPSNPFAVTYSYSASATSELLAAPLTTEPVSLPEGVLQLFSDGKLACSINVGGSTGGGECPVTYSTLGEHTVVTTYTSGSTSATETSTETIAPFATATTLAVGAPEHCAEESGQENGQGFRNGTLRYCLYTIMASATDQNGTVLPSPLEVRVAGTTATITSGQTYDVRAAETAYPQQVVHSGQPAESARECHMGSPSPHSFYWDPPPGECSSGSPANWIMTVTYPGKTGWTASQSEPANLSA